MHVIDLAIKDLKQVIRDWKSALFLVVMPILFTLFFGVVLGPIFSGDQGDPRLPVGVINRDQEGAASASLFALLERSDVLRPRQLHGEEKAQASQMIADGQLAAVLEIPAGYSNHLLADKEVSLELIADQATPAGKTASTAVETVVNRLRGAVETAHISAAIYAERAGFADETARQAHISEALDQAVAAWSDPPLSVRVEQATGDAALSKTPGLTSGFIQSSAGMIVQFAIFGLITSAMILVLERKNGSLQRLLTTPIRRSEVIAGHVLAMFLVVFAQESILVILGQYAFGVDYLRQPWAILMMMVALALWAAGLGLLIGAISKKEDQVIVLSLVAMFIFAATGGAWFPLEVTGKTFATIGHFMPTAWAMDGFQNIVMRGLGFTSVLFPAGMLLVYTIVFFGLAVWRFRFE